MQEGLLDLSLATTYHHTYSSHVKVERQLFHKVSIYTWIALFQSEIDDGTVAREILQGLDEWIH